MIVPIRRKCFISYHHVDQAEVDRFVNDFDHGGNAFIARGLGTSMSADIINSSNTDYVMSEIRRKFLRDSTVTIVMLGNCTWARRYVDWEIQSSLRRGSTVTPNGLLAVKLPSYHRGRHKTFPERLDMNLLNAEDQRLGRDCYARHIDYPQSINNLIPAIEAAYERRRTHAQWIKNPRERFAYNRTCV